MRTRLISTLAVVLGALLPVCVAHAQPAGAFNPARMIVAEHDGSAVLTIVRTGNLSLASSVIYSTGPEPNSAAPASAGTDYTPISGTLTFLGGEASKTITVPILDDAIFEYDETFLVKLSGPINLALATDQATVTILNDDSPSVLQFSSGAYNISEGAGPVGATLVRTGNTAVTSTVQFSTTSCGYYCAQATVGLDYQPTAGTITFAPGETAKTITVPIFDDVLTETNESFSIALSNPTNAIFQGYSSPATTVTIIDDEPASFVAFSPSSYVVPESAGSAVLTVMRSGSLSQAATVTYETQSNNYYGATAGADFSVVAGTLTFLPNEVTKTIAVPILDDTIPEGSESLYVSLLAATNAVLSSPSAIVTINDDDGSTLGFGPSFYTVAENAGSVTLNLIRSGAATATVVVAYTTASGTAGAGTDFTTTSGTVTFGPGETLKTIAVPILDDSVSEPAETFYVTFSSTSNGTTGTSTVTILDDEPAIRLSFASAQYSVIENQGGVTIDVVRSGPTTGTASVSYSTYYDYYSSPGPTAYANSDYLPVSGILTFGPGVASLPITIPIIDDSLIESDETFLISLQGALGGTIGQSPNTVVTIRDDDAKSVFSFSPAKPFAMENDGNAIVALARSTPNGRIETVTWSAHAGGDVEATPGVDFMAVTGTVTFDRNEGAKTLSIPLLDDTLFEPTKTFVVDARIGSIVVASATVTIFDDDKTAQLIIDDVSIEEGDDGIRDAIFTVTLTSPLTTPLDVRLSTVEGTASAGSDYKALNETMHFGTGETARKVYVQILGDRLPEGDETFTVVLQGCDTCNGFPMVARGTGTCTIRNDDVGVSIADAAVNEGSGGTSTMMFALSLNQPQSLPVTVDYQTFNGTATSGSDYQSLSGSVVFAPGQTSRTIEVTINGDLVSESDETFFVRLTNASGAPLGRAEAIGTIRNDDEAIAATSGIEFALVSGRSLKLDLYLPNDGHGRYPVILWIPGDNWAAGSRSNPIALREVTRGFAVISMDYRFSDVAKFPAQINDVKAAVRWLRANAARYNLDPSRIVIWGAGAGGHLAALAGTGGDVDALDDPSEGNPAYSSRVEAVIDWSGPADLSQLQADALSCSTTNHNSSGSWESILLGCSLQLCTAKAASADPTTYASSDDPPILLMHGAADCDVSPAQSRAFDRALRAAHVDSTLRIIEGAGHDDPFWSSDAAFAEVENFLAAKLKGNARVRATKH
ncbi:MAG: Calx-beta domain-containing protein [Acidobacteriota bacterium]